MRRRSINSEAKTAVVCSGAKDPHGSTRLRLLLFQPIHNSTRKPVLSLVILQVLINTLQMLCSEIHLRGDRVVPQCCGMPDGNT
jgi:hypothetical protein